MARWCIYISNRQPLLTNFAIAKRARVWGSPEASKLAGIEAGDEVLFLKGVHSTRGERGLPAARGFPRVSLDDFVPCRADELLLTRATTGTQDEQARVWPDDLYPHRFHFEIEAEWTDIDLVGDGDFSESLLDAMRRAAHTTSQAVRERSDLRVDLGRRVSRRNPPWAEEELVLALELYLREGQLDDKDPRVIELSEALNRLDTHTDRPDATRFRNPNGVALKLANFAALDPAYPGVGMRRGGRRDAEIWASYASDEDALAGAAERIRRGLPPRDGPGTDRRITVTDIEQHLTERFPRDGGGPGAAVRREAPLVHAYRDHLEALGHRVSGHQYPTPTGGRPFACDLFDETEETLYEAKGDLRRESIRMAIGQLIDYRRMEDGNPEIAVLLPRRPSDDVLELLAVAGARVVWQTIGGFGSTGLPA